MQKEIQVLRGISISLVCATIFFIVAYVLGAFYNTSFNPVEWTEESRRTITIWAATFMSLGSFASNIWYILAINSTR